MPKRKRDGSEDGGEPGPSLAARDQRVLFKFKQATVKLGHAFKIAKGFERQKLGRRMKTAAAESKDTDIQRIEAEIAALKTLENAACAHHHLCKSLLKIKAVADSPRLPAQLGRPSALSSDSAALNVHARLCNSNPVKEALPSCMAEVQQALGIKVEPAGKKKRLRAKDYAALTENKEAAENTAEHTTKDSPEEGREQFGEDGVSEDDFRAFEDRLASSEDDSDDGDGHDEDDVKALERQLAMEGIESRSRSRVPPKYDPMEDLSLGSDEEQEEDDDESSPEPTKLSRLPATKASAFLPSLSGAGYISGSDSDFDDLDAVDVAPRKNRPGQRARQQIWEKKYGTRAKHLQKTKRSDGWDPKRGATDAGARGRGMRRGASNSAGPSRRGTFGAGASHHGRGATANKPEPAVKKHRDDKGPIHPSWEAAKRAKEKREAPVAFQGKKVTFD